MSKFDQSPYSYLSIIYHFQTSILKVTFFVFLPKKFFDEENFHYKNGNINIFLFDENDSMNNNVTENRHVFQSNQRETFW